SLRRACASAARLPDTLRGGFRRRNALPHRVGLRARRTRRLGARSRLEEMAHAMRVLHVHRIRGIGGSERHLLTLLPALAERGVDVSFGGLDDPAGAPEPFFSELTVPFQRLAATRHLEPLLAWPAGRILRHPGADGLTTPR